MGMTKSGWARKKSYQKIERNPKLEFKFTLILDLDGGDICHHKIERLMVVTEVHPILVNVTANSKL